MEVGATGRLAVPLRPGRRRRSPGRAWAGLAWPGPDVEAEPWPLRPGRAPDEGQCHRSAGGSSPAGRRRKPAPQAGWRFDPAGPPTEACAAGRLAVRPGWAADGGSQGEPGQVSPCRGQAAEAEPWPVKPGRAADGSQRRRPDGGTSPSGPPTEGAWAGVAWPGSAVEAEPERGSSPAGQRTKVARPGRVAGPTRPRRSRPAAGRWRSASSTRSRCPSRCARGCCSRPG